ncbi:WXG100 family type VII secretion target [Kitasatospora sp. NPDC004272]
MADETVWIDLDEVEAAAKKILGLLDELTGPANQLAAKVKQVQATVYGTDLVGKAIQGGSSSVGGLAEHQEQVLQGIGVLIQNATAVGQNLQSMAARHRANDDQQATMLGGITDTGTMPAGPSLASAGNYLPGGATVGTPGYEASLPLGQLTPQHVSPMPDQEIWAASTPAQVTPRIAGTVQPAAEQLPRLQSGTVLPTAEHLPRVQSGETEQLPLIPRGAPAPPPPNEGLGNIDPGGSYHAAETPDLDYNPPPPPPFMGPGMWTPTGHGV